jgi:hypothetical protein
VALTNHNAVFQAALTNEYNFTTHTALSSGALLSVGADTNPPVLLGADSLFPGEVRVTFSEGVRPDTATNTANYAITRPGGSLAISAARVGSDAAEVILTTAAQTLGTTYTVTANGVRDLAAAANLIAANSQASFVATSFVKEDIGSPPIPGTLMPVSGGIDLTGSGRGISGANDQFTFGYPSNAVFAASFATPGPAGCHFESRAMVGGTTTMTGSFPVNYPDTWLRLRRVGNAFDGFASLDGQTWEYLGSARPRAAVRRNCAITRMAAARLPRTFPCRSNRSVRRAGARR